MDNEVMAVQYAYPSREAIIEIRCEHCRKVYYTSPENLAVAIQRKMKIICLSCVNTAPEIQSEGVKFVGSVRDGMVIREVPEEQT